MYRSDMLNTRLRQSLGPLANTAATISRAPAADSISYGYFYEITSSDRLSIGFSIAIAGVAPTNKGTFFMALSGMRDAAQDEHCVINGTEYRIVGIKGSGSLIQGAYEVWTLEET